jgi:hypothetical protein
VHIFKMCQTKYAEKVVVIVGFGRMELLYCNCMFGLGDAEVLH